MSASEVIKELLKATGLSRTRLAYKLGLEGRMIVSYYERKMRFPSHPTWLKMIELCKEYNVPITLEMLREDPEPTNPEAKDNRGEEDFTRHGF